MLGRMDDYLIHQTIDTIDHVANGDPRFQDRLYFNIHDRPGDFVLGLGLGVFPNQAVMDGFVCAVHGGRQHNLRFARPVTNDREIMRVGPLCLDIIEPMQVWRLILGPNPYGIEFDLTFRSRTAPFEHRPIFQRSGGQVKWHQQHLQQSGTYAGWLSIGGERFESRSFWGTRDRSWGVRGPLPGTAVPRPERIDPGAWLSAQFENRAIHGWFGKDAYGQTTHIDGAVSDTGSPTSGPAFVDWSYERPGPRDTECELRLEFVCEDGSHERLDVVRPILARNSDGGGYFSGFFGTRRNTLHLEGEIWDLTDPDYVSQWGLMHGEVLCEFRHRGETGWGILQTQMLRRAGRPSKA